MSDIIIPCACDEQCGRSVTLVTSGPKLIFYNSYGELIGDFVPPEWVVDALRQAAEKQKASEQ